MRNFQVLLTLICLAGLTAFPLYFTEKPEKEEPLFYDCQDRISIPVVGITSFAYCPDNHTVWTGSAWADPTNFEQRRIDIYLDYQNRNQ